MSTSVTFNGVSYIVPAVADASWGLNVSNYLIAIASGCLQKTGGAFTLSQADIDFGATYGLKAVYFKSKTANIAAAGVVVLAVTDTINWRNNANSADNTLGIDGSDNLIYNSNVLSTNSGSQTLTNKKLSDSTVTFVNVSDATKVFGVSLGSATTSTKTTFNFAQTVNRTVTWPDATDTVMMLSLAQSPTNKTFDSTSTMTGVKIGSFTPDGTHTITVPSVTDTLAVLAAQQTFTNKLLSTTTVKFADASDATKLMVFNLSGFTTGHTSTIVVPDLNGSDTMALLAVTQSFTNKTFDSTSIMTGVRIASFTPDGTHTLTAPATTDTLAALAATQAFTNKDYQGGTASNTSRMTVPSAATATLAGLTRKQATIVYDTTLNQLFSDDGSNLNPVGSGAGEKNYVTTGTSNAGGWASSNGSNLTVATDTTAADLPRSITSKSGILLTRVSGSTDYAYYRFTLDPADYNTKLKITFAMKPGASFVASDFRVDMYSNTAANYSGTSTRLALSTDVSAVSALPNNTGTFRTTFDGTGSAAPYMELRVGLNASTSGTTLAISDVIVGPGIVIQGAAITEWTAFTPTGSWSTNCTYTAYYRRVGETMEVVGLIALSGAGTNANLTVNLPTGYTINTAAMTTGAGTQVGEAAVNSNGSWYAWARCIWVSGNSGSITINPASSTSVTNLVTDNNMTATVPGTFANGWQIHYKYRVPISQWAGSGTVNVLQNDVEYAYNTSTSTSGNDTTSFANGPAGAQIQSITGALTRRVRFQNPIQNGDIIYVESSSDQITWIKVEALYGIAIGGGSLQSLTQQNATLYGVGVSGFANTTDVNVVFGQYALASGTTYGSAGTSWSGASANTLYWRVRKSRGAAAVGFAARVNGSTAAGLIPAAGNPPTQQIFTSSSGTYTTPAGVSWIRVRMVGGGGGGSGSGSGGSSSNNGGAGGNTTFGTSLLTANGGGAGAYNTNASSAGGTATVNSPAVGIGITGAGSSSSPYVNPSSGSNGGLAGDGGSSPFGGAGRGGGGSDALGSAGQTNSGSGGGGGGTSNPGSGTVAGQGGAAGGYVDAIISAPSATYSYGVGAAGTAGTAATSGHVGYAGGSGLIVVEEHYS